VKHVAVHEEGVPGPSELSQVFQNGKGLTKNSLLGRGPAAFIPRDFGKRPKSQMDKDAPMVRA